MGLKIRGEQMGKISSYDILVVDDNKIVRNVVDTLLRRAGYSVFAVDNGEAALNQLRHRYFDLVVTDYMMEPMNGMDLLCHIKQRWPATEVIMMTAFGSIENGVEAIKSGAFDYITKPFSNEALIGLVSQFIEKRKESTKAKTLNNEVRSQAEFDPIIGKSEAMLKILELVSRAATTDSTILIYGESGTGKELIAKSIHALSPRKDKPFVVINCGAITENLQESELFGHMKGAFTTAHSDKKGLFEVADGGTIFLDEVAETSLSMQVKLLRFLENNELRRVGSTETRKVDVRLLAATNKNLESEVKQDNFRTDLFYRLNVIPCNVPPLRQRKEDIPCLVAHFIKKYTRKIGSPVRSISKRASSMLINYDWPGNVRELENVVQRAVALATGHEIVPDLLPGEIFIREENLVRKNNTLSEYERELILDTLKRMNGNKLKTAQELGISKATLWRKLKHFSSEEIELNPRI